MPGPGPGSLNQMICTHTGPPTSFPRTASQKLDQNSTKSQSNMVELLDGKRLVILPEQHLVLKTDNPPGATWKMHLKLLPDNSQARQRGFSDCNMLTAKNLTTLTRHCGKSMICTWTLQTSTVVGSCLTVAISNRPLHEMVHILAIFLSAVTHRLPTTLAALRPAWQK